ncbi:MAG: M23 family metallopeptidase [Thermoanaerobaculia bacterium]
MSSLRFAIPFLVLGALVNPVVAGDRGSGSAPLPEPVLTPLVLEVANRPIPVLGSDGRYHVAYELQLTNVTPLAATIQKVEVLDGEHVVQTLDLDQVASRLAVTARSSPPGSPLLGARQFGLVHLHLVFDREFDVPRRITHRLTVALAGVSAPGPPQTGGETRLAQPTDIVFDPPLKGDRFLAADGCCDSIRHVRAALGFNSGLYLSQRFAIDWERIDAQGRILVGSPANVTSYLIYGLPIYAVANARVSSTLDGLSDSPPGQLPAGLPITQVDGNHVVLDLGDGRFVLYAHMKKDSVRVRPGQRVRRGDVLGLVGSSGNSSEPHMHFHVMDGPSPLTSNGVPYTFRSFRSSQKGVSTAAFDHAALTGDPLPLEPVEGSSLRRWSLPLDLWVVDFP